MTRSRFLTILGTVASITAILMYVSYISTIRGNLAGHKGDWIQPLVAAINCTLWVIYGPASFLFHRDGEEAGLLLAEVCLFTLSQDCRGEIFRIERRGRKERIPHFDPNEIKFY